LQSVGGDSHGVDSTFQGWGGQELFGFFQPMGLATTSHPVFRATLLA
jgi:hypothetical protein